VRAGGAALATPPMRRRGPGSPSPGGSPRLPAMADPPSPHAGPGSFAALAAVARTLGESIDLRQVFDRVAEAARTAVPFERMRVLLIEGDGLRIYASEQDGAPGWEDREWIPLSDVSPQFWHDLVVERLDVQRQLDPAFPWDRETIESGHRSVVRAMLRSGQRKLGLLGFASRRPDAFTEEHEAVVLALADLVAAALEHERMWSEERRRRQRGDALESLLPTLVALAFGQRKERMVFCR
jgi:GAF domain-containing protein